MAQNILKLRQIFSKGSLNTSIYWQLNANGLLGTWRRGKVVQEVYEGFYWRPYRPQRMI